MSDTKTIPWMPEPAADKAVHTPEGWRYSGAVADRTEAIRAQAGYIISQGGGIVGNLADLDEGEILLPSFVTKKADGYYMDLSEFEKNPQGFKQFADRVFSSWNFLFKLDYTAFSKLVHDPEEILKIKEGLQSAGNVRQEMRFATDIVKVSEERRPLYRMVKVSPNLSEAKYLFEPLVVDKEKKTTLPTGEIVVTIEQEKVRLDFDEFVAHLWNKGVRYGLLEQEIRAMIDAEPQKTGWETVARQKDAEQGSDATVKEISERMHKKKNPRILEGNRVDMSSWDVSFPQVNEGERLMEKLPRQLGTAGMNVGWAAIEANVPKDFDLNAVWGPGTKVETVAGRIFLTATMNGFINIDSKSNTISVSEKIVHRDGATFKKTGNKFEVEGEFFEEHGDVDVGVEATGHNFHVHGNVYGTIYSKSGEVVVKGNVMNGKIFAQGTSVKMDGNLVSNARIDAPGATVELKNGENSVITAKKVVVSGSVRNCTVLADEVVIMGQSTGSSIGTKKIAIKSCDSSGGNDTVITLEVPHMGELRKPYDEVSAKAKEKETYLKNERFKRDAVYARKKQILAMPEIQRYLVLGKSIQECKLAGKTPPEKETSEYLAIRSKYNDKLTLASNATGLLKTMDAAIELAETELAPLLMLKQDYETAIREAVSGIGVKLDMVLGSTIVKTRTVLPAKQADEIYKKALETRDSKPSDLSKFDFRPLASIQNPAELRKIAWEHWTAQNRLFASSAGSFDWKYAPEVQL